MELLYYMRFSGAQARFVERIRVGRCPWAFHPILRLIKKQIIDQRSWQAARARKQTCEYAKHTPNMCSECWSRRDWLSLPLDGCARPWLSDTPGRHRAPPMLAFVSRDRFDVSRCNIE
eukprot:6211738-Pleurochrysis_carterae.AAC.4